MKFTNEQKNTIIKDYNEGKSTYEIAEEFQTYANKIRRLLKSWGVALRTKSEAQSKALETGRHQAQRTELSEDAKIRISEGVAAYWAGLSEENLEKRVEKSRERWYNKSVPAQNSIYTEASEGLRRASRDGSKLERYLFEGLREAGIGVIYHKKGLIVNDKLEVDMFVTDLGVAIEVDGPSHFLPIWGEEKLAKAQSADARKAGLLLNAGFVLVRIKCISKYVSQKLLRDNLSMLLSCLQKIKEEFPEEGKRYIELEV